MRALVQDRTRDRRRQRTCSRAARSGRTDGRGRHARTRRRRRTGACRGSARPSWSPCSRARRARQGLREPRLHPLVPRHHAARHAPLVLDGGVRQPRQGDPPRPHPRRVTANFDLTGYFGYGGEHDAHFATGHVGLNVADLDRSIDFYARVFGWDVKGRGDGYAFLGDDDRLVLTLWQQSSGAFDTDQPGLHHLSFQVDIDRRGRAGRDPRPRARSEALPRRHRPARRGRSPAAASSSRTPTGSGWRSSPAPAPTPISRPRAPPRPAASSRPMWHPGERAVQERAGVTDRADRMLGSQEPVIPPVAREFLSEQPWIVLGAADASDRLWASPALRRAGVHHDAGRVDRPHRRAAARRRSAHAASRPPSAASRSSRPRAGGCGSTARPTATPGRHHDRARAGLLELPEVHRDPARAAARVAGTATRARRASSSSPARTRRSSPPARPEGADALPPRRQPRLPARRRATP